MGLQGWPMKLSNLQCICYGVYKFATMVKIMTSITFNKRYTYSYVRIGLQSNPIRSDNLSDFNNPVILKQNAQA